MLASGDKEAGIFGLQVHRHSRSFGTRSPNRLVSSCPERSSFALRSAVLKGELMHTGTRRGRRSVNQATHRDLGLRASTRSPPAELSAAEISDVFRAQRSRW